MTGPACACLTVAYRPREHEGGALSDRWVCTSCGAEFVRRTVTLDESLTTAQLRVAPPEAGPSRANEAATASRGVLYAEMRADTGTEDDAAFTIREGRRQAAVALAAATGVPFIAALRALNDNGGDPVAATDALRRGMRSA